MVLILTEQLNPSIDKIIDWLQFYNIEYLRINNNEKVDLLELTESAFSIKFNTIIIKSSEVNCYININGKINIRGFDKDVIMPVKDEIKGFGNSIKYFFENEISIIEDYIHHILESKKRKYSANSFNSNKLSNLNLAKRVGLNVPKTLITSDYNNVKNAFETTDLITKIIGNSYSFSYQNVHCKIFTEKVSLHDVSNRSFALSLFQNNIKKKFEVRSYFLKDVFYSMAIFSQTNSATEIDSRKEELHNSNRTIPYRLPGSIEKKLTTLMKKLCLETSSIDMIRCTDGKFYFLEVNPSGQFGYVSYLCNYNIAQQIVKKIVLNE